MIESNGLRKEQNMLAVEKAMQLISTGYDVIQAKSESLARRKEYLTTIKSTGYGDKVMSSNFDDLADRISDVVDREKALAEQAAKLAVLEKVIFSAIDKLPPVNAYVINQYFLKNRTKTAIAKSIGKQSKTPVLKILKESTMALNISCADDLAKAGVYDD